MLFLYKGFNSKSGKELKGKINATSYEAALQELKVKGLYISELKEQKQTFLNTELSLGRPVKNQEFVLFCRQLATLLRAGTTIADSIKILSDQTTSKVFKKALGEVYLDLSSGKPLSECCKQYPKIFDRVFVNMVLAGEVSGDLEKVMDRLATFYEKERKVREKVKTALMYPIAVSIVAVIVVILLLTVVLPSMLETLLEAGGELPLPTLIIVAISDFLLQQWYVVLLFVLLGVLSFIAVKQKPKGRYMLDLIKLRIPIFGVLIQKTIMARITRTMASLFASSVPVLQTLSMSSEIANNEVVGRVLSSSKESLQSGESLSKPLSQSWVFPPIVTHMIKVGEETGQLDVMLEKIADFYEDDVEQMASRLSSIIEPVMIVLLGLIVGVILLAALLPMYSIYNQI
ncbi:type II secretion system F family protein [Alkalihalobacillus sp. MEB130]|uniref:type II secretion system F family protein n=1 Tax=Alkalihalobacillus sp. MEB130 TaxID=2976704 RepID=UPI0028DF0771|nr:type II secretion system F family protein [Alkalihalobacillus sp. MEB130]MDT8859518.1 type II secretion system F family protein [Alkalihalobacillus sp. MEB130]